ncbi:MAG TPA: transcription termination factor NusA [Planctomycetota bacterium]|nr:transcription termination factor NusA [Planctomycetota bacterium]
MNGEVLRLVDSIHRDKDIEKELIFDALEDALLTAARKFYGPRADIAVFVDRESGQIEAYDGNEPIDAVDIGRIAAQTAKQVIIQRIRDAEQEAIFRDYEARLKQIVSGTIQRFEGNRLIVNLGRTEGILPRSEQVSEEGYRIGDRIRCYLKEVRREGSRVRIVLSRSHEEFIRRLFELEVPEIGDRTIEIMVIAREPGYRTKVAVASADIKVDGVGACVGVRGSRIKNIVSELNDEKIDIVRWSDSKDVFIANALKPAEVKDVVVINEFGRARVVVAEDELSLAIGKRGRNVRLAAKLCDCDIDILSEAEAEREQQELASALEGLEGLPDRFAQRVFQMGYSVEDIAEGAAAWAERFSIGEELAQEIYARAKVAAEQIAVARAEAEVAARAEAEAAARAEAEAAAQAEAEAAAQPEAEAAAQPEAKEAGAAPPEGEDASAAQPEAQEATGAEPGAAEDAGADEPAATQGAQTPAEEAPEARSAPSEEPPVTESSEAPPPPEEKPPDEGAGA